MARDRSEFDRQISQGAYAGWGPVEAWADFQATGGPMQGGSGGFGFDIPNYEEYYKQSYNALEDYYKRLLDEERGDVERVKRRLEEDYIKGNRITNEDYVRELAYGQDVYGQQVRGQEQQNVQEDRGLKTNVLQRGVSQGGVAEQLGSELKSRQDLRREAIDRALQKSEEDLRTNKERSLEELGTTKIRGGEDVLSGWNKFQTAKAQEREEKASGLAESKYNRDFQERSAKASFKAQEDAQRLADQQWQWQKDNA